MTVSLLLANTAKHMNRSTLLMRLYTRQIAVTMTHLYRVLAGRSSRPEHHTRQALADNCGVGVVGVGVGVGVGGSKVIIRLAQSS